MDKSGRILLAQGGEVASSESFYYSNFSGRVSLYKKNQVLLVDNTSKLIVYNEFENDFKTYNSDFNIESTIDSLWTSQKNLEYQYVEAPKGQTRVYVSDNANSDYSGYTITMAEDGRLVSYVYHLKDKPGQTLSELRIDYINETEKVKAKDSKYSFSSYLKNIGKSLTAADPYKDYEIIDQRQIQP